jgi:hypothetical protein
MNRGEQTGPTMKTRGRRSRDTVPSNTDLTLTETYLETRARPRNGLLKNLSF